MSDTKATILVWVSGDMREKYMSTYVAVFQDLIHKTDMKIKEFLAKSSDKLATQIIDKLEGDIPYRTDGEMSEVQLINECDGAFVVWDGHDQATLQLLQSIQKSGKPFFELRSSFALRVHNLEPTVVRNEAGEKVTPSGLVIP